jgi:hypothetical protein
MAGTEGQGIIRLMAQGASMTPAQTQRFEELRKEYPAAGGLNLAGLVGKPELKQDIMKMLEKPELAKQFGQQLQKNPDTIHQINYLIEKDPAKLREILPKIEKEPSQMSAILNSNVTPEQTKEAKNPMWQMGNQLGRLDKVLGDFSLGDFGPAMQKALQFITELIGKFPGVAIGLSGSREVVAAGNGLDRKDGPLQQVAAMTGANPTTHVDGPGGQVRTAPLRDLATPAPGQPQTPAPAAKPAEAQM